jgi:hypothetical protein
MSTRRCFTVFSTRRCFTVLRRLPCKKVPCQSLMYCRRILPVTLLVVAGKVPYTVLALRAVAEAGVPKLLAAGSSYAIALERLARSAGATNWFVLHDTGQLDDLAARLSPGSTLSFYFDGRLASREYDSSVANEIVRIAGRDLQAVVGKVSADGMTLEVDFVSNQSELEDFTRAFPPGTRFFFGAYPGRDNDGIRAVTIDLPDADGVVRRQPH